MMLNGEFVGQACSHHCNTFYENRFNRGRYRRVLWPATSANTLPSRGQIRTILTAACSSREDLKLPFCREGREIFDTIEVALPSRYAQIPVSPDGFFALQDAKGRLHFFVEADRGTMTIKRFTLKPKAYAAYQSAKKHTDKLVSKSFGC